MHMQLKKSRNKRLAWLTAICFLGVLIFTANRSMAADSGCVTCHLDKEMLKKNITAVEGQKSSMQSGAG